MFIILQLAVCCNYEQSKSEEIRLVLNMHIFPIVQYIYVFYQFYLRPACNSELEPESKCEN